MKKLTTILLALALIFSLAACGGTNAVTATAAPQPETASPQPGTAESALPSASAGAGTLVVYFSVMETDGVDTVAGASRVNVDGETLGNLEYVAGLIASETGGELFRIETVQD